MQHPLLPEWLFEWHPTSSHVYKINLSRPKVSKGGDQFKQADLLAKGIRSKAHATMVVAIWVDGFLEGQRCPPVLDPKAKIQLNPPDMSVQ